MSLEFDFTPMKYVVEYIEAARRKHLAPHVTTGGYLLGIAVGYMRAGGATDETIRHALEKCLVDD